jgi:hypothetical protein
MSEKVTAEDIRRALESSYTAPEWYIGFEVGNSTGTDCRRHADAIAINAYPSKGFETRGFEIKVSKQDLKAELENGIKSDEIARFCDYWFLVTPKGLVDGFTLPPTWGVIEYSDKGLRQKIKAEKLEKISPTPGFLCAMIRGRERMLSESATRISKEREEQIRREALWGVENSKEELKLLHKKVIETLNAARSLKIITRNISNIAMCAEEMMRGTQEIQSAVAEINLKGGNDE